MKTCGRKHGNLLRLPQKWVPPFIGVNIDSKLSLRDIEVDICRIHTSDSDRIIVRSSGDAENLAMRGALPSFVIENYDLQKIDEALQTIQAKCLDNNQLAGAVIQDYIDPELKGHMSNERRVSATRNQWALEFENQDRKNARFNSQRDVPQSDEFAISVPDLRDFTLNRKFASIGSYLNQNFEGRMHIEWVISNSIIWIVQIDFEDDDLSGSDPRKLGERRSRSTSKEMNLKDFRSWTDFDGLGFNKIQKSSVLRSMTRGSFPELFVLQCSDDLDPISILSDLSCIGNRLVCRTDISDQATLNSSAFNLPRTDTATPESVLNFILKCRKEFQESGLSCSDYIFIVHEYIPSVCGSWVFANPEKRIVVVDSLWGLPDGLQYLPHDSFEFDTQLGQIVSEDIRYKPFYLMETSDGSWNREQVRSNLTRYSCISRSSIQSIAEQTFLASVEASREMQVMWFCEIPEETSLAQNIAWYVAPSSHSASVLVDNTRTSREDIRNMRKVKISDFSDIEEPMLKKSLLILEPNVPLFRDNNFIEALAQYAIDGDHIIEFQGSALGHAFYILKSKGVTVFQTATRHHRRVRRKQSFYKLVRDKITDKIVSKGESVDFYQVSGREKMQFLFSKIFEEAFEVFDCNNEDDLREEIADLLEVCMSIAAHNNIDWNIIENTANRKNAKLGGFLDGKILLETEVPRTDAKARSVQRGRKIGTNSFILAGEEGVTIPYLSLISDDAEIYVGRQRVEMSLVSDGVLLKPAKAGTSEKQLSLPFLEFDEAED